MPFFQNAVFKLACGVAVGVIAGVSISTSQTTPSSTTLKLIGIPGELWLRAIRALVTPLVVLSVTCAMAELGKAGRNGGKLAKWTIVYYFITTLMAVVIGILLVEAFQPGSKFTINDNSFEPSSRRSTEVLDTLLDLARNIVADDLIGSVLQTSRTLKSPTSPQVSANATAASDGAQRSMCVAAGTGVAVVKEPGQNILGLLSWSILFGYVLSYTATNEAESGPGEDKDTDYRLHGDSETRSATQPQHNDSKAHQVRHSSPRHISHTSYTSGSNGPGGAAQLIQLLNTASILVTELVALVMHIAPLGIASLISSRLAEECNIGELVSAQHLLAEQENTENCKADMSVCVRVCVCVCVCVCTQRDALYVLTSSRPCPCSSARF